MRAVVQRVSHAEVRISGRPCASINEGLLILLGVGENDQEKDALYLAEKIAYLRIFEDESGKMNLSVMDTKGAAIVVSQFTLYGDCRKGRRPSYSHAMEPKSAIRLYELFIRSLRGLGVEVQTGAFQEMMEVELVNDGPVTLMLDSSRLF